jgi:hypothetical protein
MDGTGTASEGLTGALLFLRCACGWETIGTEPEVVVAAEEHGARVHNMRATRDEILAMVVPAGSAGEAAADPGR